MHQDLHAWIGKKTARDNLKPKELTYDLLTLSIIVMYILAQVVDSMQQEGDYVIDGFLLLIVSYLWITEPIHLRERNLINIAAIVFSIKVTYFLDREASLNFTTSSDLTSIREWIHEKPDGAKTDYAAILVSFLPLIAMSMLENKINRHYSFGWFQSLLCHGLTSLLFVYFYVVNFVKPEINEEFRDTSIDNANAHVQKLSLLAKAIYIAVGLAMVFSFIVHGVF